MQYVIVIVIQVVMMINILFLPCLLQQWMVVAVALVPE
jgi:hypothetical protein